MPETALESLRRIEKEERGQTYDGGDPYDRMREFHFCLVEGVVELADRLVALDDRIGALERSSHERSDDSNAV